MASRLASPIRLATVLALLTTIGLPRIVVAQTAVPPEQRTPPRDAKPPAERGTAIIRGRVVAGDTGRPLRRARITLTSGNSALTLAEPPVRTLTARSKSRNCGRRVIACQLRVAAICPWNTVNVGQARSPTADHRRSR